MYVLLAAGYFVVSAGKRTVRNFKLMLVLLQKMQHFEFGLHSLCYVFCTRWLDLLLKANT
jgi:hypothetical protein